MKLSRGEAALPPSLNLPPVYAQAKFLFCTDGSHAAAIAFCVLVKSMKKPNDIVNVVMISTTDGSAEQPVIDHYHDFMVENGVSLLGSVDQMAIMEHLAWPGMKRVSDYECCTPDATLYT